MLEVRDRVPALTAVLTVVSLALVFGAVGGVIPAELLPRAPETVLSAIPTVNALVSAAAIVTIVAGIRAIRRGNVDQHRRLMVAAFGLFTLFLVLYLYRVSLIGPTEFTGPAAVETYVYFPILAIHILLAIVAIPAVYYTLLLAASYPVSELARTNHPRAGKVAATLWLISFSLGIVVYLMLYVVW
ncbi:DUF420 domain-containing protein [Haloarcula sp. S1CR25-12]|uniref:DUF420 domain-containing protein n=1 Tax=Haloarcula saliterrae TaxID=2950534 RepID=A0ABU2F9P6_9EURY|nr:DUF420 domain-containing protein [Haloarcula sp. S1CR25-12]MDS0258941.1 DUF420 domain-containing protein [Haloarcula sp. S1CR25-12]